MVSFDCTLGLLTKQEAQLSMTTRAMLSQKSVFLSNSTAGIPRV